MRWLDLNLNLFPAKAPRSRESSRLAIPAPRCQPSYSPSVEIVPGSLSSPDREPASVSCAAASDGDAAGGGVNFGRWNWTEMAVLADGQLTFGPRDAPGGPGGPLIGRVLPFRRGDFAGSAG